MRSSVVSQNAYLDNTYKRLTIVTNSKYSIYQKRRYTLYLRFFDLYYVFFLYGTSLYWMDTEKARNTCSGLHVLRAFLLPYT